MYKKTKRVPCVVGLRTPVALDTLASIHCRTCPDTLAHRLFASVLGTPAVDVGRAGCGVAVRLALQ